MKIFLSTVLIAILFSFSCISQNIQIPISVEQAFNEVQPNTKVYWDLKNELNDKTESFKDLSKTKLMYIGQFRENNTVAAHVFNGNGVYIRKEIGIKPNELPVLTQIYLRSKIQHPISKASRWEATDGSIEYCVTLGQRKYLFSQHGDNLGQLEL